MRLRSAPAPSGAYRPPDSAATFVAVAPSAEAPRRSATPSRVTPAQHPMSEDIDQPQRGYTTKDVEAIRSEEAAVPAPPRRRRRRWGLILLGIFVLLPALVFTLWTVIALNYSYSSGERAGIVQKISQKGWLCKTWEGELLLASTPGTIPEKFAFTVRDDSVARLVEQASVRGERVSLHYEQHMGLPTSCFGETQYFVTGVRSATP